MIWNEKYETDGPRGPRAGADRAPAVHAEPGAPQRGVLPAGLRARGGEGRGRAGARGPRAPALHHQGRPAGRLPLRHVRGAAARHRAHPVHVGHHRPAGGRRLHAQRRAHLVRVRGPGARRRRGDGARRGAGLLHLRPLQRRARVPLRGRAHRRLGGAGLHGVPGAAGDDHARLQDLGPRLHAGLRAGTRRRSRRRAAQRRAASRCARDSSAPSRGARRCARSSSRAWASRPWTTTASPRCSAPGCRSSARRAAACT